DDDESMDIGSEGDGGTEEPRNAVPLNGEAEQPAVNPTAPDDASGETADRPRVPLYEPSDLLIDGIPVTITGDPVVEAHSDPKKPICENFRNQPETGNRRFGGNTNLVELDALGMWVALSFERGRLRRSGLSDAEIFDPKNAATLKHALVFNVSNPEVVEIA